MKTSTTLHDACAMELSDTYDRKQVERLEKAFASLKVPAKGTHCDGMAGILKEGGAVMEEHHDETTMDACLIAAAQRVEHYEMAAYGTLVAWSRIVGNETVSGLLQTTLLEERSADLKLSALAEAGINQQAAVGA